MKIAIVLCFLTVLCTVYAPDPLISDLERIKLKINNAVSTVRNIIQDLEHIHASTIEDTIEMARERWWRQMHNYRDYIHLLLGSMRREVEYAKSKDVDAQSCYNINSEAIDMHAETAYDTATKCIESAEKSIQKSLSFIDSLISLGEQLIKELKDLTMNCYDENSIAMQSCLLLEFGKVNTAVENFNDDAKNIQYSVISASNYVVLQATQCVTNTYDSAYFESYSQMISNADCVRIALDKKKKN